MPNTKVTGDLIASSTITATNLADSSVTAAKLNSITTDNISQGTNLFYTDARVSTYLSSNNYITSSAIANSANWDAAYSWGDHALVEYLTTETDPVFTASDAFAITSTQITNWDIAYGWGNHATQSYATETYVNTFVANLVDSAPVTLDTLNELAAALGDDPNFATTVSTSIGTKWTQDNTKISNWNTAYGWGNHANAGYLTLFTETDPTVPSHVKSITTTNVSNWNTAYGWGNHAAQGYLTSLAWGNVSGKPAFLTTASLIASHSNANSQVNSGFYENAGGGTNWPSQAWYNSINVRHSNQSNYHGFQVAMSYYDNLLWFRSYQGHGSFQSWEHALSSGSGTQTKSGILQSSASLRAPIFYDSNDTNYYVDPNSSELSSRLNGNIEVYARSAGWAEGVRIRVPVTNTWGGIRWTRDRVNNDGNWALGYNGAGDTTDDLVFHANNSGSQGDKARMDKAGNFTAVASSRSPIFYDSNNTGYYVDPANNTYLYGTFQVNGSHGNSQIGVRLLAANNGAGTGEVNLRMWVSEPGVSWDWGGFGYNVTNNYGSPNGFGRINTSHGQGYWRFSTGGSVYMYNTNTSGIRYQTMQWDSDNTVTANNYLTGANSLRAPIFYDSNNTGYYFDGSSTGDSIRVAGDIVAYYSDERLKDIKGNIQNPIDKVKQLNGFYYTPNETAQKLGYKEQEQVGLSAQEVEKVLPQIIRDAPIGQGYKTLDYSKVVPLLVEAIKEQQQQIEELKLLINK